MILNLPPANHPPGVVGFVLQVKDNAVVATTAEFGAMSRDERQALVRTRLANAVVASFVFPAMAKVMKPEEREEFFERIMEQGEYRVTYVFVNPNDGSTESVKAE